MLTEPWDLAGWPSPTPEPELRDRVRARTGSIRRRRSLLAAGALAVVSAFGVVALPRPSTPVNVSAADGGMRVAATEGDAPNTATTSSTASVPWPSEAGPTPRPPAPPSYLTAPAVGRVPLSPSRPPVYSSAHPLLVAAAGDAWVDTNATGGRESDPTLDITHVDVTATASAVTTELRILDMDRQPLASFRHGRPESQIYAVMLTRDGDGFSFKVQRHLSTGTVTASALYAVEEASTGHTTSYHSVHFEDVNGTIDVKAGVVRVTVSFDAMNRAIAQSGKGRPPVTIGTGVRPRGYSMDTHPPVMDVVCNDVISDDPAFTYRLGD